MNTEDYIKLGIAGVAGYAIYKYISGLNKDLGGLFGGGQDMQQIVANPESIPANANIPDGIQVKQKEQSNLNQDKVNLRKQTPKGLTTYNIYTKDLSNPEQRAVSSGFYEIQNDTLVTNPLKVAAIRTDKYISGIGKVNVQPLINTYNQQLAAMELVSKSYFANIGAGIPKTAAIKQPAIKNEKGNIKTSAADLIKVWNTKGAAAAKSAALKSVKK